MEATSSILVVVAGSPRSALNMGGTLYLPLEESTTSTTALPDNLPTTSVACRLHSVSSTFNVGISVVLSSGSGCYFSAYYVVVTRTTGWIGDWFGGVNTYSRVLTFSHFFVSVTRFWFVAFYYGNSTITTVVTPGTYLYNTRDTTNGMGNAPIIHD